MMQEKDINRLPELTLSDEEQILLTGKLYEELKRQVGKYNSIDSTSMAVEKAQDILECLIYTTWAVVADGASKEDILSGDAAATIERGRILLREHQKTAKVSWELLCRDLPKVQNAFYRSTLESIGSFFKNYNIPYEAHHIPCSIDYWPLCPVSERLKGVHYIEEYLYRIQIENDFVNYFDVDQIKTLYCKFIPHYEEALFNLCDLVLTNAVGRVLLDDVLNDACGLSGMSDMTEADAGDVTVLNADDVREADAGDVTVLNADDVTEADAPDVTVLNAADATEADVSCKWDGNLQITSHEQEKLLHDLSKRSADEIAKILLDAVFCMCKKIGFGAQEEHYLKLAIKGLPVRIVEAVKNNNLEYVFINF